VPGTEALPSPTPGKINISETEANALHVMSVMNKIAETSSKTGVYFFQITIIIFITLSNFIGKKGKRNLLHKSK
jgi:hypothetical protein